MKKEEQISVLLAALFAYSLYRWSAIFYTLFKSDADAMNLGATWVFYLFTLAIGIGGLIQFYLSRFKKSQLLRLYLIYILASSLVGFIPSITRLFTGEGSTAFLIPLVVEAAELIISFYALSVLASHRTPQVQESIKEDGTVAMYYVPASKGTRFLNRLLDTLLFGLIIYNSYQWWAYSFELLFDTTGDLAVQVIVILLLEYFLIVVYYLVMEFFFHTSFGKVFTQTTVINAQGGYPSFSTALTRTLCRLIPFDSLSFFSDKGGWHDRFSNTGVVEDKYVD